MIVNLGQMFKDLRHSGGYSQQTVADAVGVERSSYAKYEGNAAKPPLDIFCRIADFYGVTPNQLLGYDYKELPLEKTALKKEEKKFYIVSEDKSNRETYKGEIIIY